MRIFNRFRGTKGFLWLYERQLRLASMHNKKEAEHRLRILIYWKKHGTSATVEAFNISLRTLYRWQRSLTTAQGKLNGLDKRSTAPKRKRSRRIPPLLVDALITMRKQYPRIGKKKLAPLLKRQGFSVSVSYIGRCISDLKHRGLLRPEYKVSLYARSGMVRERKPHRATKLRRPKQKHGLELDTIVRFIHGTKRYIYTAVNLDERFAFAGAYTNHSSDSARDFLEKLIHVAPFSITEIQTDNGSEFAHHFHDACVAHKIVHYHSYPRCPKMNGTVERFNRTLSEDFIRHHLHLLRDDIHAFNEELVTWLLWYNGERPHEALGMLSPLQYYVRNLTAEECQMWWTCTPCCFWVKNQYTDALW